MIDLLGGEAIITNATFGMYADSNCAYDGAYVKTIIDMGLYANQLIQTFGFEVDKESVWRVILLQHIGKILRLETNTDNWLLEHKGQKYCFKDDCYTLMKDGELSLYILQQAGITLSQEEFKAIRILDKMKEEGVSNIKFTKNDTLSFIVKMANEITNLKNIIKND